MTTYGNPRIFVPVPTAQAIVFGGNSGSFFTDPPNFIYDETTGTLTVPAISFADVTLSGDITFTGDVNHFILALQAAVGLAGSDITCTGGGGGDANAALPAGMGGAFVLSGGLGGDASATQAAGKGGESGVTGSATGGNGTATQPAGEGGDAFLVAGNAGSDGGGGGNTGGDVTVDAGAGTGGANGGTISIGATAAEAVNIGRAGKTTTVVGQLAVDDDIDDVIGSLFFAFTGSVHAINPKAATATQNGDAVQIFGGDGGAANAVTAGGDGGPTFVQAGFGGAASAAQQAGDGGDIDAVAGFGGDGTAAQPAGVGGNLSLKAGDGGVDFGGGGGDGGSVVVDAGAGTGGGGDGTIDVGGSVADSVNVGRATKDVGIQGNAVFNGGWRLTGRQVAVDTIATLADTIIEVSTAAGVRTVTLPDISTVRGMVLTVKRNGPANNVNIAAAAGNTIDGITPQVLAVDNAFLTIWASPAGTEWQIIG